ncbi:Transposase DDE domain-containing protein [Anaerovirgula multivorans]|uniref:Transposase DDE domain-containing protein n=1 Tax=Anaerovirgula multivorans TaxID=312168 RepID=A0A239LP60_9FIRM|nr:IS4 family transposase [Anaerovirgula multivorans]SNT31702.1 Transposase DDE domain-containing protein [Anaerovirgula multivorans]
MKSNDRINLSLSKLGSQRIHNIARLSDEAFTRKRKMPLQDMLTFTLTQKGKTLSMEINNYFKDINKRENRITKQAFSKQRMKLNPEVFVQLGREYIETIYDDCEYETLKDYIIMAVDGTVLEVPDTKELRRIYDCERGDNKHDMRVARARVSGIYDVLNDIMIDAQIDKYTASEKDMGLRNILNMINMLKDKKVMIIFDRGYISAELLLILLKLDVCFLFRVQSGRYEAEKGSMKNNDEVVKFEINKSRKRRMSSEILQYVNSIDSIDIRITKIMLNTGEEEYLFSNIPFEDFDTDEIGNLYSKRWRIETAYDIIKNKLYVENFSGKKEIIIEQDFYAQMLLLNMIQDLKNDANRRLYTEGKKDLKYDYKINMNVFIGTFREYLIQIALENNPQKSQMLYEYLIEEATENLVPIKAGRSFPRTRIRRRNKYTQNLRHN